MSTTARNLAEATEICLNAGGAELLQHPKRFVSMLADVFEDEHAPELQVVWRNADDELFVYFAKAACSPQPSTYELQLAAYNTAQTLESRSITSSMANEISGKLMVGIARHLGLVEDEEVPFEEAPIPHEESEQTEQPIQSSQEEVPPSPEERNQDDQSSQSSDEAVASDDGEHELHGQESKIKRLIKIRRQ